MDEEWWGAGLLLGFFSSDLAVRKNMTVGNDCDSVFFAGLCSLFMSSGICETSDKGCLNFISAYASPSFLFVVFVVYFLILCNFDALNMFRSSSFMIPCSLFYAIVLCSFRDRVCFVSLFVVRIVENLKSSTKSL